jgi:hypothetical protein
MRRFAATMPCHSWFIPMVLFSTTELRRIVVNVSATLSILGISVGAVEKL